MANHKNWTKYFYDLHYYGEFSNGHNYVNRCDINLTPRPLDAPDFSEQYVYFNSKVPKGELTYYGGGTAI